MKTDVIEKFDRIWKEAQEAAEMAASTREDFSFPCGFAWITVPGRGNFGQYAKDTLGAHKNYSGPGFNIWYSKVYSAMTQSMDTHVRACHAAAEVLRENGINATVHSRMD